MVTIFSDLLTILEDEIKSLLQNEEIEEFFDEERRKDEIFEKVLSYFLG